MAYETWVSPLLNFKFIILNFKLITGTIGSQNRNRP